MDIITTIFFNVIFGFLCCRIWNWFVYLRKNGKKQSSMLLKIITAVVSCLCLVSFCMQIILLLDGENQLAKAMQLLACVLLYASGNLMKPEKMNIGGQEDGTKESY